MTLRARIARIAVAADAPAGRFVADVDAALQIIVAALRSGGRPGALPPLRNDQIALRNSLERRRDPAVEVLVSETDLIVDSVNTMAAVLARTPSPERG